MLQRAAARLGRAPPPALLQPFRGLKWAPGPGSTEAEQKAHRIKMQRQKRAAVRRELKQWTHLGEEPWAGSRRPRDVPFSAIERQIEAEFLRAAGAGRGGGRRADGAGGGPAGERRGQKREQDRARRRAARAGRGGEEFFQQWAHDEGDPWEDVRRLFHEETRRGGSWGARGGAGTEDFEDVRRWFRQNGGHPFGGRGESGGPAWGGGASPRSAPWVDPVTRDHCQALGVAPGEHTCPDALRRAHRVLCLDWHPDRHSGEAGKARAEERFKRGQVAYDFLKGRVAT